MHGETITILLIILVGFTTHQGLKQESVGREYLFSTEAIRLRRQWYRLVTPAFLHADWGHFAGNALSIYIFGSKLENVYGPGVLLRIFFLSVVGGSLLCLLLHRHGEYRALGASGGALGLIFATVFLFPSMRIGLLLVPVYFPAWIYAVGYLLYTIYGVHSHGTSVSHEGHLGGLLTGCLLAWGQNAPIVRAQLPLFLTVLGLSALGLWYFHANPGRVPGFLRFRLRGILDDHQRRRHAQNEEQLDALLDKVARDGIHSLSARERSALEAASKRRGGTSR